MKLKNSYFFTLREDCREEESTSGNLLTRAGMIKKASNGIYMYLPLGYKVIKNIEKIIREEMENISAGELLMPTLLPKEMYEYTNKLSMFGEDMFSLKDRFDKEYYLAPTHEETFMDAALSRIKSYKDMPFTVYQISDKFRDEERCRYGLIRVREILMKDAYSFSMDEKGLDTSYNDVLNAYKKIFARLGIENEIVKSSTGKTGGLLSEEFQAIADIGEDKLVICPECGYASNSKIAKCTSNLEFKDEDIKIRELIKTPNAGSIKEVSELLGESEDKFVKTLIYEIDDKLYACMVRGNAEVNEQKVKNLLDANNICLADKDVVSDKVGASVGFIGPVGLDIPIIMDNEILNMKNFIVGANKTDYHFKNVNLEDFNYDIVDDIRCIKEDDVCPCCGKNLVFKNGTEIANMFKLGTMYSEKVNLNYLDKNNENKLVWMGSYSIGIGRCLASIVEQHNDSKGIIWPLEIAPFKVAIVVVNTSDEAQMDAANYLYKELRNNNISTILDDRIERVGVKFNDMDLIGIPIRITIGNKINDGLVEIKKRIEEEFFEISLYDALVKIEDIIEEE